MLGSVHFVFPATIRGPRVAVRMGVSQIGLLLSSLMLRTEVLFLYTESMLDSFSFGRKGDPHLILSESASAGFSGRSPCLLPMVFSLELFSQASLNEVVPSSSLPRMTMPSVQTTPLGLLSSAACPERFSSTKLLSKLSRRCKSSPTSLGGMPIATKSPRSLRPTLGHVPGFRASVPISHFAGRTVGSLLYPAATNLGDRGGAPYIGGSSGKGPRVQEVPPPPIE